MQDFAGVRWYEFGWRNWKKWQWVNDKWTTGPYLILGHKSLVLFIASAILRLIYRDIYLLHAWHDDFEWQDLDHDFQLGLTRAVASQDQTNHRNQAFWESIFCTTLSSTPPGCSKKKHQKWPSPVITRHLKTLSKTGCISANSPTLNFLFLAPFKRKITPNHPENFLHHPISSPHLLRWVQLVQQHLARIHRL